MPQVLERIALGEVRSVPGNFASRQYYMNDEEPCPTPTNDDERPLANEGGRERPRKGKARRHPPGLERTRKEEPPDSEPGAE